MVETTNYYFLNFFNMDRCNIRNHNGINHRTSYRNLNNIFKTPSVSSRNSNKNIIFEPWKSLKRLVFPVVHAQSRVDAESTPLPTSSEEVDNYTPEPAIIISEEEVNTYIELETGRERIRDMFFKSTGSKYSAELSDVVMMTCNCGLLTFVMTSMFGGYVARDKFVERNKHRTFDTKFIAFRRYNDAMMFGSLRFGFWWMVRVTFFTGMFMLTAQSISVYRNRTGMVEYITAGGLTCGLLRFNVGLRGMFAGSIIGAGFGLVGGIVFNVLKYSTNDTQQKNHFQSVKEKLSEKRRMEHMQNSFLDQLPQMEITRDAMT